LRGRAQLRVFQRFAASPTGAKVIAERRRLLPVLEDRARLQSLDRESLGGCYLTFMQAEHLDADGLVIPSAVIDDPNIPAEMRLLRDRMRDAHDLNHVVTGYGREPVGELCLLAFMYGQTRNRALAFLVLAAVLRRGLGPSFRPARRALREAWRRGRAAAWLPEQDWEALLDQPLEAVREGLRMPPAPLYQAVAA
jgi:ubiquinone biosynthesis protein COQ4